MIGVFQKTGSGGFRPGKSPLGVAEEFRFKQIGRDGRHVDGGERIIHPDAQPSLHTTTGITELHPTFTFISKSYKTSAQRYILFRIIKEEESKVDEEEGKLYEILDRNINELELSVRPANCLRDANIRTIGELVKKTDSELLATKNFGKKSLQEIKNVLEELGLHLGMDVVYPRPSSQEEEEEQS